MTTRRIEAPSAFTVRESAERVGNYRWIERRLFETLGGWVPSLAELDVKLVASTHAHHHAWRSDLFSSVLPSFHDADAEALTGPPGEGVVDIVDRIASAASTIERLTGVYRVVVPRLLTAYGEHRSGASQTADGPLLRVLDLVTSDTVADWREGERLLQGLLVTGDDVERAGHYQTLLEVQLVAVGGLLCDGDITAG